MVCNRENPDLGFLMKKIDDTMQRNFNQRLKESDITLSQLRILRYIREYSKINKKPITQKEIEQYLEVSHPTVVGLLKRLEMKGFIRTEIITGGRITKRVVLTGKEEELKQKFIREHEKSERSMTKGFTKEELERLKSDLKRILNNIQEEQNDTDTCETNQTI